MDPVIDKRRHRSGTCEPQCLICGSTRLTPRFRVAFPTFGPDLTYVWPLNEEPPVASWTITRCVHLPNPFPGGAEIHDYYSRQLVHNDWEEVHYVAESAERTAGWSKVATRLTRLNAGPGEMLEVGPAAGHLMKAAQDQGWSVTGVEASPKFTRILRERGLPFHEGTLATLGTSSRFDLIVMLDVLEHLHDPVADLARCADLLRENGSIVVATCDIGSFAARYYGLRWRQIVISHVFYWTRSSLDVALRRAGLEPRHFSSVRWWDPDSRQERVEWLRELGKLLVRKGVQLTWMPLAERFAAVKSFQRSRPAFDHWLDYKIGNQAVMSDVLLVVAGLKSSAVDSGQTR
jgi:SAM-dependent methyltransferase